MKSNKEVNSTLRKLCLRDEKRVANLGVNSQGRIHIVLVAKGLSKAKP